MRIFILLGCLLALLPGVIRVEARPMKKVVLIAGKKSHGPGDHEYEKGCRLLARCLETAPGLKGQFRAEVHTDGWPADPKTLDDADTIVLFSDGSDHNELDHPILHGDRLETLRRQMQRGAGLVAIHYTVFVPQKRGGPEFLDWIGGFFDYESGAGKPPWYSKIQMASSTVTPASPKHPIARGLAPFALREEFYYKIRFRENDPRLVPIATTTLPNEPDAQTIAWAVQRREGGRGFGYTGGHFHSNWQVENVRKMLLNAIVWTAKGNVPKEGVQSTLPDESRPIHALILTGHHHPAHDWKATTEALTTVLGRDPRMRVTIWEDPERLAREPLHDFDLLIQNYCNWERPGLSDTAKANLLNFVRGGKGFLAVHFANGAFLDWPDYRRLVRRVWLDNLSGHDAFGPFQVQVRRPDHPITQGLEPFDTIDELYFGQQGDLPIEPLVTARSKVTGRDEPMAWAFDEGRGRVFQTVLGHDARSILTDGTATLIRRAAAWVARREPVHVRLEVAHAPPVQPGRFGNALSSFGRTISASMKPAYQQPPLTVEFWAKVQSKTSFNIFVANSPKESRTHWELYTAAGSGNFCAYLPGCNPSVLDSGINVADGQWRYYAMIYEPERVRLYINGRCVRDQSVQQTEGNAVPGPLTFGGYPLQGLGCDGLVDEVRISNTIRAIASLPEQPFYSDAATIGLWRFDSLNANRFTDYSPLKNDAALERVPGMSVEDSPLMPPRAEQIAPFVAVKNTTSWPTVGNDPGGMRYSPLTQINRDNVQNLNVAWVYHTGDANPDANTTLECTPIVVEGVLYLTTVNQKIVALNAATGKEIWKYDPFAGPRRPGVGNPGVNRGVAYWSDNKPNGLRRLLIGLPDGRLLSLDARTGNLDPAFGKNGELDLRAGIERDIYGMNYGVTSPPAIFGDIAVVPITNTEAQPGAPGDIRAFDVRTGREVWRFHTVPLPYELGNETWEGDSWKNRSGTNAWAGFTVDTRNGIVFAATGSAASDFYGGDRRGMNLFANCVLALDARTGKRLWHFQTVHHDLWDHDNPCPPVLVTVLRNGKKVEAVAQPTKTGFIYLFERKTGKPLFEIQEVPAVPSDVPGEYAWPTQPEPIRPPALSPKVFDESAVTDISPESRNFVLQELKKYRYGKKYQPPSVEGTVVLPGFHGGATWSGASFDPTSGLLYVNTNNVPYICAIRPNSRGGYDFQGYTYFNDQFGYPASKPPWGNLTAVNLNTGEFAWRIPFGEYPELRAKGVPVTGTENFGGTIVTAGGLVFIGGTKDEKFHAYDKASGQLLWEYTLPAGGYATPCTYAVNGKQYVVIAAGGGGKLRTKSGDAFVAFALP
jgi:quinoprotein glucose dehydrogenase